MVLHHDHYFAEQKAIFFSLEIFCPKEPSVFSAVNGTIIHHLFLLLLLLG